MRLEVDGLERLDGNEPNATTFQRKFSLLRTSFRQMGNNGQFGNGFADHLQNPDDGIEIS